MNVDGTSAERRIDLSSVKVATSTDRINDLLKLLIGAESLTIQQLQEYSRQFSSYRDDVRSEAVALEKRAQNMILSLNKAEAIAAALGLTVKTKEGTRL